MREALVDFLKKVHLNGVIENALIWSTPISVSCRFLSDDGSMAAHIEMEDSDEDELVPEGKYPVHDVGKLIKILNVFNTSFINIDQTEMRHGVTTLSFSSGDITSDFCLGSSSIIKKAPSRIDFSDGAMDDIFFSEDMMKYYKSGYSALGSPSSFAVVCDGGTVYIVLNHSTQNVDNVSMELISEYDGAEFDPVHFNASALNDVLKVNKDFDTSSITFDTEGLLQINFNDIDTEVRSQYNLLAINE